MKKIIAAFALMLAGTTAFAEQADYNIIPLPKSVDVDASQTMTLRTGMGIAYDAGNPEASRNAQFLRAWIEEATGLRLELTPADKKAAVRMLVAPQKKLKKGETLTAQEAEAYTIVVDKKGISISAASQTGLFRAAQTLRKAMPVAKDLTAVELPFAKITDQPRFEYRGVMLDCARHYFPLETLKKFVDVAALHGCNQMHWHLTEDQGWRMEVKAYPRLTEVGAWRNGTVIKKDWGSNDGIRYGGFYTQEEMKEIVAYAAERGITVIPEVDLPGHMVAALAAYPELGCTGGPYEVWTRWGVAPDILCAGNEAVYTFLETVLTELVDVFPSEYIHIGGDEAFNEEMGIPWDHCPKCAAKMRQLGIKKGPMAKHYLQNYVTARMQDFLNSKGRKIIGWDEVLEGNLAPGATVMSWRGVKGGIEAANKGFDAIMTPNSYLYFDYYQSQERDKEPYRIGKYLPLEKVYGYEPMEGMPEDGESHILGVQCNLWAEFLKTETDLEYQLLPRMSALSEVGWIQKGTKDFDRFRTSLDHMKDVYEQLRFTYCKAEWGLVGLPGHEIPARSAEELDTLDYNKVPFMEQ